MHISIPRGIDQIGGCITEISTENSRIFIDMGDNLPSEENMSETEKQRFVNNLFENDIKSNEAVFFTHAHSDHIGMMAYIPDNIPLYMSEETKMHSIAKFNLLSLLGQEGNTKLCDFSKINLKALERAENIYCDEKVIVGDISIVAYKVPHSAHGSIMLLIELDGKRILHTGDFKRKGLNVDFIEQIKRIGQVDIVITEGTMLNRTQSIESEEEVYSKMVEVIKTHKYIFVLTSSLNSDRLASIAKAAKTCKKPLTVCSSMMQHAFNTYQHELPQIFGSHVSFYPFDENVSGRSLVARSKITKFESWVDRSGFVECVGIGQFDRVKDILTSYDIDDCALIYSVWPGYYKIPEQIKISPNYKAFRDLFTYVYDIHASGHADSETIAEMLTLLNPTDAIIGIHKEPKTSLCSLNIPDSLKAKIIPDSQMPDYVSITRNG